MNAFWAVASWVPLIVGLLALLILVVKFSWDFGTWWFKHWRNH